MIAFSILDPTKMAASRILIACLAFAAVASASTVTLRVFSGTPDPTWTLSAENEAKLRQMLATNKMDLNLYHIMGYTGFEVCICVCARTGCTLSSFPCS